ncbi:hypothetical protein GP5015_2269 [gamma proteobacterium HTCC5015]|nr:hypothetical protein GP5015_2269 [gamma proteobacterium HTCC5015]
MATEGTERTGISVFVGAGLPANEAAALIVIRLLAGSYGATD